MKMICPRCSNTDPALFYKGSKGVYCRACIRFSRFLISENFQEKWDDLPVDLDSEYSLDFSLTKLQKSLAQKITESMQHQDTLLWAVTGAGKTELCMDFISQCLRQRKRVAVVIARRQVVLELAQRFSQAFHCHVSAVCEGHTDDLDGDLMVMTAHQCYRFYEKKFDHIIVDEPDAFPYFGNSVLQAIVRNSCTGTMLYLTATPDKELLQKCHVLQLFSRPHGRDLPVPRCFPQCSFFDAFYFLVLWCVRRQKCGIPFLIFAPTIQSAQNLTMLLKLFVNVKCCTSKTKDKDQVIESFKSKQCIGLVCTTILERGVTFEGIDVFVYHADHSTFSVASLVQIAGRVGRKPSRPFGDCVFQTFSKSTQITESIEMIRYANTQKMSALCL